MEILSIIFFMLAAICNAVMDTLQFHWHTFKWRDKVDNQYWSPNLSWHNKYVDGDPKKGLRFKGVFGFMSSFLDAWHLFKSTSIVLIVLSIVFFPFAQPICFCESTLCNQLVWVAIFGLTWNFTFNFFFNTVLVDKKK